MQNKPYRPQRAQQQPLVTTQATSKGVKLWIAAGVLSMVIGGILVIGAAEAETETLVGGVVLLIAGVTTWMIANVVRWWNHG